MQRKQRETTGRNKNSMDTDDQGNLKPRRQYELKAAPQRRQMPKDKCHSRRRQHAGGERSRRSLKETQEHKINLTGRGREGSVPKNNIGSDGKGTMVGRRNKLRIAKYSKAYTSHRRGAAYSAR